MGYPQKNCLLYEKIMFEEEKKLRIFYMLEIDIPKEFDGVF
jgi:hypothetical protein